MEQTESLGGTCPWFLIWFAKFYFLFALAIRVCCWCEYLVSDGSRFNLRASKFLGKHAPQNPLHVVGRVLHVRLAPPTVRLPCLTVPKLTVKMQLKFAHLLPLWVLIGCLVAAVAAAQTPMQLKVFRGTLVHSRVRTEMEVLENHLLGINESNYGAVSPGME